jgi:uncharacterized membrane protein YeaQ/YmgE (transglycosylase-associated protein family)
MATLLLLAKQDGLQLESGSILRYLLVGLVVGVVARLIVPGWNPLGVIGTIVVGIVGAVLGDWLAGNVFDETEGIDWLASILVAVILVYLLQLAIRRRRF